MEGIIGVDIDGTVADTGEWFAATLSQVTGKRLLVKDVTGHDWIEEGICTQEQQDEVINLFYEGKGSLTVPSMEDAVEVITKLNKRWWIYFVTARPESMREDTEIWLEKHGFPYDRLILTGSHNKHELDINFETFIDDRYETALAMAKKEVTSLLFHSPWNSKNDTSYYYMTRVYSWEHAFRSVRRRAVSLVEVAEDYAQSN